MSLSMISDTYHQIAAAPAWVADVFMPLAILQIFYWVPGLAFLALDHLRWTWWSDRKCQPDKRLPRAEVLHICWYVGIQLVTVYPLAFWLLGPLARARLRYSIDELPDATTCAVQLAGFGLATEAYFYYTHRLLHHPKLYLHLHKVHHRFTYPIALECLYFHPVESVMQLGTVMLGPLLLGSHVTMLWAWEAVALLNIALHHAGHDVPLDEVPGLGSMAHQHDYHHMVSLPRYCRARPQAFRSAHALCHSHTRAHIRPKRCTPIRSSVRTSA
jgi:methylsterol monooxygenase